MLELLIFAAFCMAFGLVCWLMLRLTFGGTRRKNPRWTCPECGYNKRASGRTCPECGTYASTDYSGPTRLGRRTLALAVWVGGGALMMIAAVFGWKVF